MIYKLTKLSLLLFCAAAFLSACKKEEGFGGNSTIRGKLTYVVYNEEFNNFQGSSPAMDKDVYILFGNETANGDNVKTSSDGTFEFNFLQPGDYTIYAYSDTVESVSLGKFPRKMTISISKGQTKDVGNFYISKTLEYNEGSATIKGVLMVKNYTKGFGILKDITPGQDEDVYLAYNGHKYYDERNRTFYDGTFVFRNLIKGTYKIYAYSDDYYGSSAMVPVLKEVVIDRDNQVVDLDTIYVERD